MNTLDVIEFCVANVPPGYVQDRLDVERAREVARGGELRCLVFTYDSGCAIGVYFDPCGVYLDMRLSQFQGPVAPFTRFIELFGDYVRKGEEGGDRDSP
jgi:hypothetical protein